MKEQEHLEQLGYLIACLQKEMPEYAGEKLPQDPEKAFTLFRALCNVRMPQGSHLLPDAFYTVEKEVLQRITAAKGVVDGAALAPMSLDSRISLWQGDITRLKVDAIVNAANSGLLGCFRPLHNCIDNCIHTMAGVELRKKCLEIMEQQGHEEATGTAKITSGYNLPARYVLHTVGPIVSGRLTANEEKLLASCYRSCLDLAAAANLTSIAFCCISTGVFMFPNKRAAEIAIRTVQDWLRATQIQMKVVFTVFKDVDREIYHSLLG